ncbi:MAG: ferredoxin [Actinomycetota bacterium]|jgi:ferredoxin
MRIHFEPDACVGHGRCYALAPQVFDADDLGHCVVLLSEPPAELADAARLAVASCPEDALTIDE